MSNINKPNTFSSGTTISSSDVNDNFDTIYNDYNGNITSTNLADDAVSTSKIADGAVTAAKLASGIVESGWVSTSAPNTVTCNGNRSYDLTFNSVDLTGTLSKGMRLKLTRTVTAPTQCTSLNGTTQYYSKASPSGMTFTDDFTVSAWVKPTSYAGSGIMSCYNGTSGWILQMTGTGQVRIQGIGAAAAPNEYGESYQSLPLNKWTHVAATLDMSGNATTIYFDGVLVPSSYIQASPGSSLVQAGNLEVGSYNGGNFFPGKIAQASVFSAVLSASTIKAMMNQTLTGSETSLVSAYTFNNSINDLSANANNLTAQGSAVATATDTPFTNPVTNTSITAGTTNYAIITAASFSTNTTLTVQVPEGETLPTSGGISAVSYSTQKIPYAFPIQRVKWVIESIHRVITAQASPVQNTWYNIASAQIAIPIGEWEASTQICLYADRGTLGDITLFGTLSTANNSESDRNFTSSNQVNAQVAASAVESVTSKIDGDLSLTAQTIYYHNMKTASTSITNMYLAADRGPGIIRAKLAYL